ncbi:MAG: LysM domain-containing protein, partial [Steroidobacteraceae bacterium]
MAAAARLAGLALVRGLVLVAVLAMAACAGADRKRDIPDQHVVRAGETLYSISMRYGLDYHDVARWNGIGRDFRIVPGQRLRLNPPPGARRAAAGSVAAKSVPSPRASADD